MRGLAAGILIQKGTGADLAWLRRAQVRAPLDPEHADRGLVTSGSGAYLVKGTAMKRSLNPRRIALLLALAAIGAGIVILGVSARGYEVLGRQPEASLVRIDVLGWFTLDADPEVKPTLDVLDGLILTLVSGMALLGYLLLRRLPDTSGHVRRFFAFLSAGSLFLALDELIGAHEVIGYNLRSVLGHIGTHEPDDVIIIAYAIPVAIFLISFRDIILSSRRARVLFLGAVLLYALAAMFDALTISTPVEDTIEALTALTVLAGTATLLVEHLLSTVRATLVADVSPLGDELPQLPRGLRRPSDERRRAHATARR